MGVPRIQKEKFPYILVSRTVVFFFLMCLLALLLYAAGTAQSFIDSTQLFLLRCCESLGIFLLIASVCGAALNSFRLAKTGKKRYALRAGGYVLLAFFAAAVVFTVMSIAAFSQGSGAG